MIRDDMKGMIASGIYHEGEYGIEIETETKASYKIPKFHYWDVKPDGSLRDFGQEYVLKGPVSYDKDLIPALEEFKNKTKGISFIEDSNSTSVHVHCNILPETWQSVGNFLTIYTLVENLLMEVAGDSRRNNLFCLPIRSVPSINKLCVDIFKKVNKKNFSFSNSMDGNAVKYAALNLAAIFRFGSLEIRSFRGVTDIDIIKSWIDIIHKMRVYSCRNITPPEILDQFRDKGKKYLKDIFEEEWDSIKDENDDKLIMDNLWFAGHLAYNFSPSEWKKFDIPMKKPEIPEGMNRDSLEFYAVRHYGCHFDQLNGIDQMKIIQILEMSEKKRKAKSVFGLQNGVSSDDMTWVNSISPNIND